MVELPFTLVKMTGGGWVGEKGFSSSSEEEGQGWVGGGEAFMGCLCLDGWVDGETESKGERELCVCIPPTHPPTHHFPIPASSSSTFLAYHPPTHPPTYLSFFCQYV